MEKPRPDILKVNPQNSSAGAQAGIPHRPHRCSALPAGSFGHEESPCYAQRAAGSQRLRVQPDQAGPGCRDASATVEHRHSAPTGGHEDVSQPPTGSFTL